MYQPDFQYNDRIVRLLARIHAAREIILNTHVPPSWERRLQINNLFRLAYHATSLEENGLSIRQVTKLVNGQDIFGDETDKMQVLNFLELNDYLQEMEYDEITEDTIFTLHKIAMKNIAPEDEIGKYRTTIMEGFMEPERVRYCIRDLLEWAYGEDSDDVLPALKAAIVHFELYRMHPFEKASGTVARSVSSYMLAKNFREAKKLFTIEEFFNQGKKDYFERLEGKGDNKPDINEWLEYYLYGLALKISRVENAVLNISRDYGTIGKYIQTGLKDRQLEAIRFAREMGKITNKEYQKLCDLSVSTAKRDLQDLVKKKIFIQVGRTGRGTYYKLRFDHLDELI
ncbi:Fic family protein [Methanolobus bombayensis]|uniref:Fic family protein n=1 Tax=Methanolobus bombayensis TaxID=38023 RepID=UPI001AE36EE2|nr:Fic family protein [Methanolobus bombayensis]MBP1909625.1 Fic family protein [Methanolobus bombayensis]